MAVKEKIEVEGNFKEQILAFVSSLKNAKSSFKDLTNEIKKETQTSGEQMTYFQKRVEQVSRTFIKEGDKVKEAIKKATREVQSEQEYSVDIIAKKYIKLGETIQGAYAKASKRVDITYNGSKNDNPQGSDNGFNDFVKSFFGSSLGKGLTVLGVIQASVKGVEGTFKLANNISSQTLGAINTLSGNMISAEGVKQALGNAMDFEDVKSNIMVLSKQLGFNGQQIYEDATKLAIATRFTEKDVTENATWMLKAGINPDQQMMTALANLASLKPKLGAEHAGFAVFDAMAGRVTSLKTNYGIDNSMLYEFQKGLSGKDKNNTQNALQTSGNGFKVTDKQEYANLLELYINSKFPDLAKSQSKTLSGLFSTMTGGIEQLSSDLMGFNTQKGEITKGSFLDVFKNAMGEMDSKTGKGTGFLGWLAKLKDNKVFTDLEKQIGNLANQIVGVFQEINDSGTFDTLMTIGSDFLKEISTFIKDLKDTGQLDKVLKDFPNLVKVSLDYELAKLEALSKMEPLIPIAIEFLKSLTNFIEFLAGKAQLNETNKKIVSTGGKTMSIATNITTNPTLASAKAVKWGWEWLFGKIKDKYSDGKEKTQPKAFSDISAQQWVDKYAKVSDSEKDQIKEMIKTDNTNTYNIELKGGETKEEIVQLLIETIEKSQNNS
ncbi:hypothetical protein AB2T90_19540 [Clostridium butyricum]|uniref:hypothetical protein n=1 Tax=Clostridium butyricum TaxID=1492 RepID=UPI003464ECBB